MKNIFVVSFLIFISSGFGCKPSVPPQENQNESQGEAREDSLQLAEAIAKQSKITWSVTPDVETKAVRTNHVDDDAADDMAVWVNKVDPEKSLIFGANKKGGIVVYNLTGEEIAFYPTGRINNIDVMYDVDLGNTKIDIVGCTNRSDQSIDLLRIHPDSFTLSDIAAHALAVDSSLVDDIYGFCFYKGTSPYLFINGKNGRLQQYEILTKAKQKLDLKLVRQIVFDSQTEGLVADEQFHTLYAGEEDAGVWKLSAKADGGNDRTLIKMSNEDNPNIAFDIEGLTIYKEGSEGYLLASSQGNFSYAVFSRGGDNAYLGSFKISDGVDIDGVEETDGIDAVSIPVGSSYPKGIFLVQDGFNYDRDSIRAQNFKIVDWNKIHKVIQQMKK